MKLIIIMIIMIVISETVQPKQLTAVGSSIATYESETRNHELIHI